MAHTDLSLPYYSFAAYEEGGAQYTITLKVFPEGGALTAITQDGVADALRDYLEALTGVSTTDLVRVDQSSTNI